MLADVLYSFNLKKNLNSNDLFLGFFLLCPFELRPSQENLALCSAITASLIKFSVPTHLYSAHPTKLPRFSCDASANQQLKDLSSPLWCKIMFKLLM